MKSEFTKLEAALQARKAELSASLATREGIRIEQTAEQFDAIQNAASRDIAVVFLHNDSQLLRRVDAALARIDDGSYGTCTVCENEIAPKRLHALPWAERCVTCQEEADRQGRLDPAPDQAIDELAYASLAA